MNTFSAKQFLVAVKADKTASMSFFRDLGKERSAHFLFRVERRQLYVERANGEWGLGASEAPKPFRRGHFKDPRDWDDFIHADECYQAAPDFFEDVKAQGRAILAML